MRGWLALAGLCAGAAVAQMPSSAPASQSWEPYSAALQARATAGDAAAQFSIGEA